MRDEYDFEDAEPNPHASRLNAQLSIRLDAGAVQYFKSLAKEKGIPFKTLIGYYLNECADKKLRPEFKWDE